MMVKIPRVSVLMPAYNSEKYIAEAIESILNQTFTDFEFIIMNDCSTDKTAKVIEFYAKKDSRIKHIKCPQKYGLTPTLNMGIDLCRGEYIARMDADDISLPQRLEKQVSYMDRHPNVGVLGTSMVMFGKSNQVCLYKSKITLLDLIYKSYVAHPSVLLRKSVLDKYNIKYKLNVAEDYDFWVSAIKVAEIHNLPDVLLKYRIHDEQKNQKESNIIGGVCDKIKQNIIDFITDIPEFQNRLRRMAYEAKFYDVSCLNSHMLIHHPFKYMRLKRSLKKHQSNKKEDKNE